MGATRLHRRAGMRAAGAVAALGCILLGPASGAAASGASWSVEGDGILSMPVAPSAFRDGWKSSWGLAGSVRRSVGAHTAVGLEGLFAQFGLGDLEGEGVSGGTRRWGSLRVPVLVTVWEDVRGGGDLGLTGSTGYAHQSIEPISNAKQTPRTGNADGPTWSVGLRYSHSLRPESRWTLSLEYAAALFAHETPGALLLRVGVATPLRGTPGTP
jgi:hypothetical protein